MTGQDKRSKVTVQSMRVKEPAKMNGKNMNKAERPTTNPREPITANLPTRSVA
jgi:hypothetical protein